MKNCHRIMIRKMPAIGLNLFRTSWWSKHRSNYPAPSTWFKAWQCTHERPGGQKGREGKRNHESLISFPHPGGSGDINETAVSRRSLLREALRVTTEVQIFKCDSQRLGLLGSDIHRNKLTCYFLVRDKFFHSLTTYLLSTYYMRGLGCVLGVWR